MGADDTQILGVYWGTEKVGSLTQSEDTQMRFEYHPQWIEEKKPPISQSMPVAIKRYEKEAKAFFGNLLPEGDYRRYVERIYQVSSGNDFSLLKEIGGDCAGALTLGEASQKEEAYYEPISPEKMNSIVRTEGAAGLQKNGQSIRLSLAGAQGKLPFRYRDGIMELPYEGAVSTHIMKFNKYNGEYPRLVENEFFLNRTAHHLGMLVVNCELKKVADGTILIVERYDRTKEEWPKRIHQEDYCQALGYNFSQKYEKEKGPTFKEVIELTRKLGLTEVKKLIDWYIFNLFMGNSDAHAKNISILYEDKKGKLAPFYDLVCTRAYVKLDRNLAMSAAGEFDPDLLTKQKLNALCEEIGIKFKYFEQRVLKFKTGIDHAMAQAEKDILNHGFELAHIQNIKQTLFPIHKRLIRTLIEK